MKTVQLAAVMALVAVTTGAILAQKAAPARSGYLTGTAIPDMIRILPSPPATDSARDTVDRAIFVATRSLKDSPRWKLAQSDDDDSIPGMFVAFRCASGVTLTNENAPRTATLLERVSMDINRATGPAKARFQRKRPFLVDAGPVCVGRPPSSPDFPSSHAALGWAVGLILTELMPDHRTEIMVRARAFGESRIVCGVHNSSAVEAGRVAGAALLAALHSLEPFRADLEAAKGEIVALHGNPSDLASRCVAEAALIAKTPY